MFQYFFRGFRAITLRSNSTSLQFSVDGKRAVPMKDLRQHLLQTAGHLRLVLMTSMPRQTKPKNSTSKSASVSFSASWAKTYSCRNQSSSSMNSIHCPLAASSPAFLASPSRCAVMVMT